MRVRPQNSLSVFAAGAALAAATLTLGACGSGGDEELLPEPSASPSRPAGSPSPGPSVSPSATPTPFPSEPPDPTGTPQDASVRTRVVVPASLRSEPFDQERELLVPPGFGVSVYARVPNARFLASLPNGDLLVSQPARGGVALLRQGRHGEPAQVFPFIAGLRLPHDIVPHQIGGQWYVYIAESNQINRFRYTPGDITAGAREVLVSGLPDSSSPELKGAHGHQLKNIAVDSAHRLYVSSASATNADPSDVLADPARGAIHVYSPDGSGRRLFATGLRNAEGLAFVPGTDELWVAVNNRDNIRYPLDDGTGRYGQIVPDYVDDNPPEPFTRVRDGGNYGWPYANPDPRAGLDDMPYLPDYENNRDGSVVDVSTFDRADKGLPAHSAPLGLTFFGDTNLFARQWRNGAAIALHGSWNRQRKSGAKVVYFEWAGGRPGRQIDMITGWLHEGAQQYWGRPVDTAVGADGVLYVSDDHSGTVYRLAAVSP